MTLPIIPSLLPRPVQPEYDEFTLPFWDALQDGDFVISRCNSCAELQFPPRPECAKCLQSDLHWHSSDGRGTLYAATRIFAAGGPFACMTPYSVGLVDLHEGVRILTRLLHSASSLPPGSEVQIAVVQHTDGPLFAAIAAPHQAPENL